MIERFTEEEKLGIVEAIEMVLGAARRTNLSEQEREACKRLEDFSYNHLDERPHYVCDDCLRDLNPSPSYVVDSNAVIGLLPDGTWDPNVTDCGG